MFQARVYLGPDNDLPMTNHHNDSVPTSPYASRRRPHDLIPSSEHAARAVGMAGPLVPVQTYPNPSGDDEGDYGSDFSPEEQEIIDQLLVSASASLVAADRPITNDVEYAAAPASARGSRLVARETVEIEYESRGVANVQSMQSNAEIGVNINIALDASPGYPDCKSPSLWKIGSF